MIDYWFKIRSQFWHRFWTWYEDHSVQRAITLTEHQSPHCHPAFTWDLTCACCSNSSNSWNSSSTFERESPMSDILFWSHSSFRSIPNWYWNKIIQALLHDRVLLLVRERTSLNLRSYVFFIYYLYIFCSCTFTLISWFIFFLEKSIKSFYWLINGKTGICFPSLFSSLPQH